jgi:hypothetical protein
MVFIYPPLFFENKSVPIITNPFDRKQWFWKATLKKHVENYEKIFLTNKNGHFYLKKGTRLYHGSLVYPFYAVDGVEAHHHKTFFGLDVVISLWYILEQIMIQKKRKKWDDHAYLYEFVLTKDIPVSRILRTLDQHPKDTRACGKPPKAVCLHPQIAFHGVSLPTPQHEVTPLFDLCNEVTLDYQEYKDSLRLVKVHLVNPNVLFRFRKVPGFDPVQSIFLSSSFGFKKDK